jgi:hypothetical protein
MALYDYENGIRETVTTMNKEVKQLQLEKPALEIPALASETTS